jgi:hypothetical protein
LDIFCSPRWFFEITICKKKVTFLSVLLKVSDHKNVRDNCQAKKKKSAPEDGWGGMVGGGTGDTGREEDERKYIV